MEGKWGRPHLPGHPLSLILQVVTLLLAFLIGFLTGLRSFTPAAVTAWGAHLGWLKLQGWLADVGTMLGAVILTVLALAELVADKSPRMRNRTAWQGVSARILMGGLTGACIAAAGGESLALGAVLGGFGGIAGCLAGYHARRRLVQAWGKPDYYVAVLEDLVAIGGSVWVVSRFI
jgi:uncharacterized membrane protein